MKTLVLLAVGVMFYFPARIIAKQIRNDPREVKTAAIVMTVTVVLTLWLTGFLFGVASGTGADGDSLHAASPLMRGLALTALLILTFFIFKSSAKDVVAIFKKIWRQ